MQSLLNLSNEILGDIIVLALGLNDTRLPFRYRRGILYMDFRCRKYGNYENFWWLLHTCRRLRECTFDQMLQRANFEIHETAGLQLLVADFHQNGFLSRLKNLEFHFSAEKYYGIWGNGSDLGSLAALTDVAVILSQLPAGLRRLEMNFTADETYLDFGVPLSSLIQALHRFQELEELLWYCDLSLFDFEWYPAAPPFGQWATVADCYKLSTDPDYVKDIPRDRFQDIPLTIPRDVPAFPALSRLTLTSTIVLLPRQMAEALSAQQLPSLTCLHFLNIRWPYDPENMDPIEWPIARRCFARMNALNEFRWEAHDVTTPFQSLAGRPEYHIPPTAETLAAIRDFHGSSVKKLTINYQDYPYFGDESRGSRYVNIDGIDWVKFTGEMAALERIYVVFNDSRPNFTKGYTRETISGYERNCVG